MSDDSRPARRGTAGQTRRAAAQERKTDTGNKLDATTLSFIALVVVIIAGSVFFVLRDRQAADTGAIQEFSETVDVAGDPLPRFDGNTMTPANDPAVGMPAPTVTGEDFQGDSVAIPAEDGATILAFLAHWCPHCQSEVPLLVEEWLDTDLPDGVNVIGVATGSAEGQPNYPPSDWLLADSEWSAPILADSQASETAEAFGLSSYPYFVVVGADGTVLARSSGELGRDQLDAIVDVAAGSTDTDIGDVGVGTTVEPSASPQ